MKSVSKGPPSWAPMILVAAAAMGPAARGDDVPPHGVDLVQYGGNANTVVVQMLNLTPYDITYVQSDLKDQTNRDRNVQKSFMFAPVGIPATIPKVPPEAFSSASYTNTTTHLYSGVVSWCDSNGLVKDSSITWQVNGVTYYDPSTGQARTGNPKVQLHFTRSEPTLSLKSAFFYVVKQAVNVGLAAVGFRDDPMGGPTWMTAYLAEREFQDGTSEFVVENTAKDNGKKMWVGAYVLPETGSCRGTVTPSCAPSKNAANDAVDAQWGSGTGGLAESQLVITTQLLRGSTGELGSSFYGTLPIVQVTFWDYQTYFAAYSKVEGTQTQLASVQGGQKVQSLLRERGRAGLLQLRALIGSMDPKQRESLSQAYQKLFARRSLEAPEKQVLADLALAFESHAKTMRPATQEKGGPTHVR